VTAVVAAASAVRADDLETVIVKGERDRGPRYNKGAGDYSNCDKRLTVN
jgi:hypothetical protein